MSKTYRIHGARYLRKYTAPEKSSIYSYMADVRRIANTLCTVPWERVKRDIAATTTIHTEEGLDWNVEERERFDAAEWCGEHSDGFHRAFAQAACYVFKLPASAVGTAVEKIAVQVTGDPYNPYGARISAMTSATLDIPMDCATVRTGEMFRAPDAEGMGAAPRLFVRNADGTQNWYANSERVELSPGEGQSVTLKQYLFVFCVLENYNRGRDGWIEGSSYIDNDVELTLSAACDDLAEGELNDLSGVVAASSFAVVSGGVMAALPAGDCGVRALTVQRTGDDFVRNRAVSVNGLFARTRVNGLRALDVTSTDAVFREPLFAGAARGVGVLPGLCNYRTGGSTTDAKHSLVFGSFADGSFPDLPGLLLVSTVDGANAVIRSEKRLDSLATGDHAVRLAALKAAIEEDGGIGGAWLGWKTGGATYQIFICTKSRHYLGSAGTAVAALTLTWGADLTAVSVGVGTMTDAGGAAFFAPYLRSMTYIQTAGWPLVHDADGKRIGSGIAGGWVSYEGTVTAIRPVHFSTDLSVAAVIVSGALSSVGGVACSNCAIVRFSDAAAPVVTVPACDADITPDIYRDFAVSCPCTNTPNVSTFYVTGGFSKLGGVDCEAAAKWSGGTLAPLTLPDGTRPPEFFLVGSFAGSDNSAIWVDDSGSVAAEETATDVWETPKAAVTDAQSAFGLRRLYAALYGGALQAPAVVAEKRPGAAFVVHGDEITVKTADGDVAAKCWNLSASVLAVPFSCPREFAASKVRLDWPAVAATAGARVNVWLKRGEYLRAYPTSYPKALFTGEAKEAGGWELVGTVTPADGTAGSATLDVDPIVDDAATLLFVAFVGQDDFNPSAGMTLPRGVGSLNVNAVAGTATGLDAGFRPDVTLIG